MLRGSGRRLGGRGATECEPRGGAGAPGPAFGAVIDFGAFDAVFGQKLRRKPVCGPKEAQVAPVGTPFEGPPRRKRAPLGPPGRRSGPARLAGAAYFVAFRPPPG